MLMTGITYDANKIVVDRRSKHKSKIDRHYRLLTTRDRLKCSGCRQYNDRSMERLAPRQNQPIDQ